MERGCAMSEHEDKLLNLTEETPEQVEEEKNDLMVETCCGVGVTLGAIVGAAYTGAFLAIGAAALFTVATGFQLYEYLHYCQTHHK